MAKRVSKRWQGRREDLKPSTPRGCSGIFEIEAAFNPLEPAVGHDQIFLDMGTTDLQVVEILAAHIDRFPDVAEMFKDEGLWV